MDPFLSIVIATSGRIDKLGRLLGGLSRVDDRERIQHEVVIANNSADEPKARAVEELVDRFSVKDGGRCWQVREPVPGKCRAQNRAIGAAKGTILAFLDDDLEVSPQWLQSITDFFASYPHDIMQGSILMHDEDKNNAEIRKALNRYRTIDFIDYGYSPGTDLKTLTGGNIAVRREVFNSVGLFNDRLGPGEAGISEDVEFAQRVLRAGKRIGYEPRAAVYNEIDRGRFTEEYFRFRHELQGRSRLLYKQSSLLRIAPNLLRSLWTFAWYSLTGNERKKYRSKGRFFHYRAMLVEKTRWLCKSPD